MAPAFAVPDQQYVDPDLKSGSPTLNASPSFPFIVCRKNGYFELDPPLGIGDGSKTTLRIRTASNAAQYAQRNWPEEILMSCEGAINLVAGPSITATFANGLEAERTDSQGGYGWSDTPSQVLRLTLEIPDVNKFRITTCVEGSGSPPPTPMTLEVADLFDNVPEGQPVFNVGYIEDKFYAMPNFLDAPYCPAEGTVILSMAAANTVESIAATVLDEPVETIPGDPATYYWVATLSATNTDATAGLGVFRFVLATGDGDTDNDQFVVQAGNRLVFVQGGKPSGTKDVRVKATNEYGDSAEAALTLTF